MIRLSRACFAWGTVDCVHLCCCWTLLHWTVQPFSWTVQLCSCSVQPCSIELCSTVQHCAAQCCPLVSLIGVSGAEDFITGRRASNITQARQWRPSDALISGIPYWRGHLPSSAIRTRVNNTCKRERVNPFTPSKPWDHFRVVLFVRERTTHVAVAG